MDFDLRQVAQNLSREKQKMTLFKRCVTEGHERADELANDGAMMDGGDVAQIRASTVQQKREEVYAAFAVRS